MCAKRVRLLKGWAVSGLILFLTLLVAVPASAATQNWTFDAPAAYTVSNSADVEWPGGVVRLKEPTPSWWTAVGNFRYRRQLRISAGSVAVPANTPVRYALDHYQLVQAGLSQPSGNDVRLAYYDGSTWTEIPRFNEGSWATNGSLAQLWFKTQAAISAGGNSTDYYLYYGDASLGAPTNATRPNVYSMSARTWDTDADWNSGAHTRTAASGNGELQEAVQTTNLVPTSTGVQSFGYSIGVPGNVEPPSPVGAGWVAATAAEKTAASAQDGSFYVTRPANGHDQFEWQLYKFPVGTGVQPLNLTLNWKGYGDPAIGYYTYVYLWNHTTQHWENYLAQVVGTNQLITIAKPAPDAASYVNQTSGEVWVGVGTKHSNTAPTVSLSSPGNWGGHNRYDGWSNQWNFSWTASDPESDSLTYVVTIRNSGGAVIATSPSLGTTTWSYTVPADGTYYWRVRATDSQGAFTETPDWAFYLFYSEPPPPTSCPFLFVWNGKEYRYFGDLAGQTLGPDTGGWAGNMRPSAVALPGFKPDEKNLYRVKIREPLTEINFFDEAKLLLVDHPAGYEVISSWAPNLYRQNPVPPLTFWTLKNPRLPVKAYDSQGNDILPIISAVDNIATQPPTTGSVDYILDFGKIEHPEHAKLVVDGWKFIDEYSRASTEPFSIAVVDKDGSWKKLKGSPQIRGDLATVVWDLSNAFPSDDHRIKLVGVTSRRVTHHFDRIRLDDSEPVPVTVTEVPSSSAVLSHMGFLTMDPLNHDHRMSALDDTRPDRPDSLWFGDYTKYGEVGPLLAARDDRFVILRHGDGVELAFPAPASPPTQGMERTPILLADIWYQTRSRVVGPYPFKGMTAYPPKEQNPNLKDPSYQEYIKTWNTRHYDVPEGLTWEEGKYPDPSERPPGYGYGTPKPLTEVLVPAGADPGAASAPATAPPAEPHYSVNTDYVNVVATNYANTTQNTVEWRSPVIALAPAQVVALKVEWLEPNPQQAGTSITVKVTPDNGTTWYTATNGGTLTFGAEYSPVNCQLQAKVEFTTSDTSKTAKLQWLTLTYYTRTPLSSEPSVARESDPDQNAYPTTRPSVQPKTGVLYTTLSGFRETLSEDTTGSVGYQISRDGSTWYYWNNGAWTATTTEVSSATVVNANVNSFLSGTPGDGTFFFKAFLISNGAQSVKLDNVALDYTLIDVVTVTPSNASPGTVQQGTIRVPVAKFTMATNHNSATWSSFSPSLIGTPGDILVGGVIVWRDNGDDILTAADEQIGSGTFDALGRVAISLSVPQVISTSIGTYFVSYDLTPTATVGNTPRVYLETNSFGFVPDVSTPNVVAAENLPFTSTPIAISDLPDTVLVSFDGVSGVPTNVTEGDPGLQLATIDLATSSDRAALSRLTVDLVGTAVDSDLPSVRLYRSANGTGSYSPGVDQLLATATFSGRTATLSPATADPLTSATARYFLVVNTAAGSGGHNFALRIPAGGIQIVSPDIVDPAASFPMTTATVNIAASVRTMTVSVSSAIPSPATALQGTTDVPFLRIYVSGSGALNWNALLVNRLNVSDISQVKVWRDLRAGSQPTFDPAQLAVPALGATSGNSAGIAFTAPESVTTATRTYWVTGNIAQTDNEGHGVRLSIDYTSAFGVDSGTSVNGTVMTSAPVTVLDAGDEVSWTYSPKRTFARQGDSDVVLAALRLSTSADYATLNRLTLSLGGDATTLDLSGFKVYADANGDGQLTEADGASLADGVADWTAAHTVTFDVSSANLRLSSTPRDFLIVANVSLGATVNRTLALQGGAGSIQLAGNADGLDPAGTVLDTTLRIDKKPQSVVATALTVTPTGAQGETNRPMGEFSVATAENDASLTGVTVTLAGDGPENDVTAVKLWRAGTGGAFSADDSLLLATGTFSGGAATLTIQPPAQPVAVTTTPTSLYLTFDFSTSATIGATFAASLADASAVSVSGPDSVDGGNFPLIWASLTLNRTSKQVALAKQGIQPSDATAGLSNLPVLAFRPSVASDDTILTAVVIDLTGSGPATDITRVRLWRDNPATHDGLFSASDDLSLASGTPSGGRVTLTMAAQTIAWDETAWFYVTYDVSATAAAGGTHGAQLAAASSLAFTRGDQATGAFPMSSGEFTLRPLSNGIPAVADQAFSITRGLDNDSTSDGVQTPLYGQAGAPVTVRVQDPATGTWMTYNPPVILGSWTIPAINWQPGRNVVEVTSGGVTTSFEVDLIDPEGIVYDSITGAPMANATVSVYKQSDDSLVESQPTGTDGRYSFLVPAGSYYLTVAAPGYHPVPPGAQFVTAPAGNGLGTTPGSQDGAYMDIYYGAPFTVVAMPLHFDIPLDPTGFQLLALTKTADRPSASVGDLVAFRIKIVNPGSNALAGMTVVDTLPAGLTYLAHSTLIGAQAAAEPAQSGNTLTFSGLTIPASGELWLSYRVVVGAAATPGDYVNTAVVQRAGSQAHFSNVAIATVRVVKDQLFQAATLLGRVFRDDDGDGFPGATEGGLGGVRVVVDDGTILTTDANGRFHLNGLASASRALKVDPVSLPGGAALTTPNPVMVTLRPGLPSDVSFGVKVPAQAAAASPAGAAEFHLLAGEARFTNGRSEGRLAGYLRREVLGGLKLVASLDTSRAKTAQPGGTEGQGYTTFGDQSKVDLSATKSSGPLYLSLTGQTFQATLGDFQLPAPQDAGREATGALLNLHTPSGADGKANSSLSLYGGSLAYQKVRDELKTQDGSLYYLSHHPAVSGTERLWLEARDEATTRVIVRIDLARGRDYEIDYPGGRIITRTPLPSTVQNGSLLGQPVEADRPVYLVADYQYDSGAAFSPQVYGGRGEAAIGPNARASVAVDVSDSGKMVTGEVSGKAGTAVEYRLQAGTGHTTAVARYTSNDGGVTYQAAPEPAGTGTMLAAQAKVAVGVLAAQAAAEAAEKVADQKADAGKPAGGKPAPASPAALMLAGKPSKTQSQVAKDLAGYWDESQLSLSLAHKDTPGDTELSLLKTSPVAQEILAKETAPLVLPGWWKAPEGLVLEGKLKETTAGFTAGVDPAATDQTQVNLELKAKPGTGTSVTVGSDANYAEDHSDRKVTAAVRVEEKGASLTAQFGQLTTAQGGTETLARTLSAKYEYPLNPTTTVSLGRKINYDEQDLNVTFLGGSVVLGRTKVEAEYDTGETQNTGKASLAYELPPGGRLYGSWEGGERDGTTLNQFTFGGSAGVATNTRVFLERKLDAGSGGVAASETAGAEWRPTDKLGYSFSLSHGLAVNGAERSSEALALDYREEGRLGSAAVEVANQSDGRRDVSLKGKAELALTGETTLVGRALVTQTSGAGFTGGNISELGVGAAYRPVNGDRLNLLSQVTLRNESGDASGSGSDSGTVTSLVLSSEGLYRLNRSWRLGGKAAWKRATGDGGAQADTLLLASRALYQVAPGVELAGEYRMVRQGSVEASGPVVEADVAFPGTNSVWLGIGYNYAGFSDSLLGNTSEAGWFLRIRGLL